ncbi:MAG: c-type cytochrome [Acidobacteriota bacterium]
MRRGLKTTGRWAAGLIGVLVAAAAIAVLYATVGYRRAWEVPLPATHAVQDPAAIARGRYIVYGPGRCADCHSPDAERAALFRGEDVSLTGGPGETTYLGTWTAPNLTPDPATGIGHVSDAQLARMIRYGVNRQGHIGLPFMDSFANLTESDLVAVLSFLRSLAPAPGTPPDQRINLLGKIALAYFIEPYAPVSPPPAELTPAPTAKYGEYLAKTLGGCGACHTARSLKTGEYLSPFFSGGLHFRSRLRPDYMFVSPNLTPDAATGQITRWTEADFIQRFRHGLIFQDSPMPWGGFTRLTDDDLRALYRFLHSLPPVRHDVGPTLQPARGQAAG